MTREKYKEHLKDILQMAFVAETAVLKEHPDLKDRLRRRDITPDEYLGEIADEILSKTPDSLINDI